MTLELRGLHKVYDDFEFGPVELTVDREVLAILGPSGSGKTTLLSLLAGVTSPDSGRILLDGEALVGRPIEDRRVGLVFQDGALFPHMTARENIEYATASRQRVDELSSLLELDSLLDRRPADLSGGERQRVALARTLAADPDVLLLDEPLSSLDTPIRRRLRDELHTLFGSLDIPILYVTHDQRTATALGDRLGIVRDGTLEQVGPPPTVLDSPATPFVARFTGTENLFDGHVTGQTATGALVEVGTHRFQTAVADISGETVTVCLHPARLELAEPDTNTETVNTATGTVSRWLNVGTDYRVDIDTGERVFTVRVCSSRFEQLPIEAGAPLRVVVPPEAVHLIHNDAGESNTE
jgi:molybdate/tungstate transport system ATP-binding protein